MRDGALASGRMMKMAEASAMADTMAEEDTFGAAEQEMARMPMPAAVRAEQQTMAEYRLPGTWRLDRSNGSAQEGKLIDLTEETLTARFRHLTVPQCGGGAYLVALISDAAALAQVDGEASIYLDGAFVGKASVRPERTDREAELSLGHDAQVQVERREIRRFTSKVVLTGERKAVYEYEIAVTNHKRKEITILVKDQLPVSQDKSIHVSPVELSGASVEEDSGELSWERTLQPDETVKIPFSFEVKIPKDQMVNGL